MINFQVLPASYGDALLLYWEHEGLCYRVLIDGGIPATYKEVINPILTTLVKKGQGLDLAILTHVDFDHISGILALASDIHCERLPASTVKEWWFNSLNLINRHLGINATKSDQRLPIPEIKSDNRQISFKQGIALEEFLQKSNCWRQELLTNDAHPITLGGARFTFLAPHAEDLRKLALSWEEVIAQENNRQISARKKDWDEGFHTLVSRPFRRDSSLTNASSIAFLWEYAENSILFLADSQPDKYLTAIERIKTERGQARIPVDVVKLAHHGSKHNFSEELLDLVECNRFVISTDASKHGLPDKETLVKIICHKYRNPHTKLQVFFNYGNADLKKLFANEHADLTSNYNTELVWPIDHAYGIDITI